MNTVSSFQKPSVAIIGIVGVPAAYGGFETLADELLHYAQKRGVSSHFVVYCSGQGPDGRTDYCGAQRRFISIPANGVASIFYDMVTSLHAWWCGADKLLILGVSGAPILLFLRLFTRLELVINVDGIEWKRAKWNRMASLYLRFAEWLAVKLSHHVVADNKGIQDYLSETYNCNSSVITYGGDHAMSGAVVELSLTLPERYALSLCRIEPENNVHLILEGFSKSQAVPLVFVGNWDATSYGRELWRTYGDCDNLTLLKPIYDEDRLYTLRRGAEVYVHGHSAGGTNPSLVEMMHFGIPVIAFDCVFNRYSTDDEAIYFFTAEDLADAVNAICDKIDKPGSETVDQLGQKMANIAKKRYVWSVVGERYLNVLGIRPVD